MIVSPFKNSLTLVLDKIKLMETLHTQMRLNYDKKLKIYKLLTWISTW